MQISKQIPMRNKVQQVVFGKKSNNDVDYINSKLAKGLNIKAPILDTSGPKISSEILNIQNSDDNETNISELIETQL